MSKPVFNKQFLETLRKIHDAYGAVSDVIQPINDTNSLISTCVAVLRKDLKGDAVHYDGCGNELIKFRLITAIAIRDKIIEKHWDGKRVADWMYHFSKEIWAKNAKSGAFAPIQHKDETTQDWEKRRALGARNTLPKVIRLIDITSACLDACHELDMSLASAATLGAFQASVEGSSLGVHCGFVAYRAGLFAKSQIPRIEKIQKSLQSLYTDIRLIGESA